MHCSSPKMVCETKIVADEHDAIPGSKKEPPMMWSASPSGPGEAKDARRDAVFIREFERGDQEEVRRIFYEGIMERIPNTAFRGLRQQSRTQFLYALLTVMCFSMTKSFTLTCCVPLILMGARYYYSRKVIHSYLDHALHTDMADIEAYYMKPTGSCFWVAVLDGHVVGIVAAQGREDDNMVELRRMSVDSRYRGKGIAKALGRRVLEFAVRNNYAAVVLGTTAVKMAAHKLYESLGFCRTGQSEDYRLPGMSRSMLERLFFQIRYSRYRLQLREE
ncbi:N-acetylaspartate synthetase [Dunckerocampus dactyliophorus]|uniref:N-acetylaspartate synthetase n=1 Tax=Dunckerocampus dactyliophorus TaxID=161453 RepID=UPI0024066F96|nr:N-acetylaspartate synthetase [Dunckerocampus dactyliophorus]